MPRTPRTPRWNWETIPIARLNSELYRSIFTSLPIATPPTPDPPTPATTRNPLDGLSYALACFDESGPVNEIDPNPNTTTPQPTEEQYAMATEVIQQTPKGTTLYEARIFRRKGSLYLFLKSAILEEHFKAISPEVRRSPYYEWYPVDPVTLIDQARRTDAYTNSVLMTIGGGYHEYGSGSILGDVRGDGGRYRPNLTVFLRPGLADGICYRISDTMLSHEGITNYLASLKEGMRKYFETAMARVDITMTVTTLKEVA